MIALFDAWSLLFRAHYALPTMTTRAGEPTAALYGFSTLLLKVLREHRPTAVAVAVDAGPSFRAELFDGYKAGRARTPDELTRQLDRFGELLTALRSHAVPGFEADDVLATLARRAREAGQSSLVVSGDRDLLQTAVRPNRVLFVGRRGQDHVLYDQDGVEARFGVPIASLPSYVAVVGDPSDALPGLPGVGPKTAARWIAAHRDVDRLLAAELDPARLRPVVAAAAEQLRRNEQLARLRDDVPLDEPLWTVPDLDGLGDAFERLEFASLAGRLADIRRAVTNGA